MWRYGSVLKGKLTPIQDLLPSVLAALANSSGNARNFKPAWDRIVGPVISRHSTPVLLQGDVLAVEVTDPAWARELAAREAEIRARLGIAFGKKPISRLVFRSSE